MLILNQPGPTCRSVMCWSACLIPNSKDFHFFSFSNLAGSTCNLNNTGTIMRWLKTFSGWARHQDSLVESRLGLSLYCGGQLRGGQPVTGQSKGGPGIARWRSHDHVTVGGARPLRWVRVYLFVLVSGRRMCPGNQHAKLMMFLILSNLLQNFRFELPPGEEPGAPKEQFAELYTAQISLCAKPLAKWTLHRQDYILLIATGSVCDIPWVLLVPPA